MNNQLFDFLQTELGISIDPIREYAQQQQAAGKLVEPLVPENSIDKEPLFQLVFWKLSPGREEMVLHPYMDKAPIIYQRLADYLGKLDPSGKLKAEFERTGRVTMDGFTQWTTGQDPDGVVYTVSEKVD